MTTVMHSPLSSAIASAAHPLKGAADDYDPLLELVGDARFVLLGEASHGTHEFYQERASITQRLIAEKGFTAVAVEADWPDAYRVNRYVRARSDDADAGAALAGFLRFPTSRRRYGGAAGARSVAAEDLRWSGRRGVRRAGARVLRLAVAAASRSVHGLEGRSGRDLA